MSKVNKYVVDGCFFTDIVVEKIRSKFNLSLDWTNQKIREGCGHVFMPLVDIIYLDLVKDHRDDIFIAVHGPLQISPGRVKLPNTVIEGEHYKTYMLNQFNNLVGMHLWDLLDDEISMKEVIDEKIAFYFNINTNNIALFKALIKRNTKKNELLEHLNRWVYDFKSNQNLLQKLPDKKQNFFLEFLSDSIEFLKVDVMKDWVQPTTDSPSTKIALGTTKEVAIAGTSKIPNKREMALICFYNNTPITKENATEIAKRFGHDKAGSLFQDSCYYKKRSNRLGVDDNSTSLQRSNKIIFFISVIEMLEGDAKKKALDELNILKSKIVR